MRITLMHNPKAGDAEHGEKQLMTALAKAGHHATYQSTKKSDYKKALKKPTDLVLAAGGDGTVGKIGSRLIDSGIPLSVLPLGTANNLARSLGFIASPEEIIGRLEGGKKLTFDVGLARRLWGKRYFFESVGGGLLADYVSAAKRKAKKTKTLSSEQEMTRHVSLLRRMVHEYPTREWKIDIDGEDVSDRYILWEAMNIVRLVRRFISPRRPRPEMASSISCVRAKAIAPFSWIILMQGWQGKSPNSHCRFDGSASYRWFGKDRRNFTSTTNSSRAKNRNRNSAGKLRSQCDHPRS